MDYVIFIVVIILIIFLGLLINLLLKISPSVDTLSERKKFAIFHTCTLVVAPIIAALMIFVIKWINSIGSTTSVSMFLNPFTDSNLLLWSLIVWNTIGSLRFYSNTYDIGASFIARCVGMLFMIIFPFYYLYNLWYIFIKRKKYQ